MEENGGVPIKKQIRKAITAKLRAMPAAYRSAASESITAQVLASEEYRNAARIFAFIAMPTEPDTRRIIERALADGKHVYLPKCISKTDMLAVRIKDLHDLKPGAYGIPEPQDLSETVDADVFDLILVPCVSASRDGRRLGHGAGYYDRFLKGNAEKTVCLCFSEALCDEIPMEENDIFMHKVIFDRKEEEER
jgi:5-formyltetrahydrofolate cyclo-ligase